MAEKINVAAIKQTAFSVKSVKDFSLELASEKSKLGIGSLAAALGGMAAASVLRAVKRTDGEELNAAGEKLETLRKYFIFLIDEEIKAKEPLESRLGNAEIGEAEIEGGYRTACVILSELLYTLVQLIDVTETVADKLCPCTAVEAASAMYGIRAAYENIRLQLAYYSTKMNEPVYARTTRREPELVIEQNAARIDALLVKFEAALQ